MKHLVLIGCILSGLTLNAQDFDISNQYVSREVLENYLEHSMTMQGLADVAGNVPTEQELEEEINVLINTKAKFVGRMGYFWSAGDINKIINNTEKIVCTIKTIDPQIICQGAIFEHVSQDAVLNTSIPSWVFDEFGLPVGIRNFNQADMLYAHDDPNYNPDRPNIPDMSKQETQMWFYYMARRYIDAGCEALHFGDFSEMSKNDPGNVHWWSLLQRVRNYAATKYNQPLNCNTDIKHRGIVLCDAHTHGAHYNYGTQLLFDFHSFLSASYAQRGK